jgi:hypothetical protein
MHGGTSSGGPEGNRHTLTHGIYGAALDDDEKEMYADMFGQVGHIEEEITLARIQLFRAKRAKQRYESGELQLPVTEELKETEEVTSDAGNRQRKHVKQIRRHPDYDVVIDRCLGRIGNLERIRFDLLNGQLEKDQNAEEKAVAIVEAVRAMNDVTTRQADEPLD